MSYNNVLITGGCGFIGSNYINHVLATYPECQVYNLDCLNYCANEDNIHDRGNSRYILIKGDITDKDLVSHILEVHKIDTIIHFAAQSHVDGSFSDSLRYTRDNVQGTHTLLECTRLYGRVSRFIHFSTDEVYGDVDIDHPGCMEKSLLNPTNPYAATKAAAEFLVRSYHHSFQLPTIIIRCNNAYGPNQYHEKLIPRFTKLLKEGNPLTIHGKGDARRNFIHVDDVVTAVDIVLRKGAINDIYNIGTSNEYSVIDIARILVYEIHNDTHYDKYLTYVPDRPYNDSRYMVNADKLKALGWKERHDFIAGLRGLI